MPIRASSRSTTICRSNSCCGQRVRGPTLRPLAIALVIVAPLAAQGVTTAAIRGTVLGPDGTPIAAAAVQVTNLSTGERWQAQTSTGGHYVLEGVAVGGPYGVGGRGVGFRPARQTGVTLQLRARDVAHSRPR